MTLKTTMALLFALCVGAAFAQANFAAATNDGLSISKAVVINASNEQQGVAAEYHWIADRYPGYKRDRQALLNDNHRFYDEIDIVTSSGNPVKLYFDISSFFGKM